ncbi:MAG: hypothetical protein R3F27_11740 [Gammaproteobacteria bacterium]
MRSTGMVLACALLLQPVVAIADNLQSGLDPLDEVLTVSKREVEIRHLFGVMLDKGTATVRQVGEAFLPEEPQPGLQFNINPDTDEIYVGWRFQF